MQNGLVYIFTGDGKGKTSAAIGVAVRAVGAGMNVGWVGWYKQASWKLAEKEILEKLGVEVHLMGKGFHLERQAINDKRQVKTAKLGESGVVVDTAMEAEHKKAAEEALEQAGRLIGKVDLLVMDEINNAVKDGLITLITLIDLISKRGKTHIILTGRDADQEVIKIADLVTEMKKIKHPYDLGKLAVRGLDF
jgi:cob(I)alamin adenosyltransferase